MRADDPPRLQMRYANRDVSEIVGVVEGDNRIDGLTLGSRIGLVILQMMCQITVILVTFTAMFNSIRILDPSAVLLSPSSGFYSNIIFASRIWGLYRPFSSEFLVVESRVVSLSVVQGVESVLVVVLLRFLWQSQPSFLSREDRYVQEPPVTNS